jgi:hypothetical protein
LEVRALTQDHQDVRVLMEVIVWVAPPQVGEGYVEPHPVIDDAARAAALEVIAERPAEYLGDAAIGVAHSLLDRKLHSMDGSRTLAVVSKVRVHEIELLLPVDPADE